MDERDRPLETAAARQSGDDTLPAELRLVARRYAAQPVPGPTPAETARLVARVLAEEPIAALANVGRPERIHQTLRVARWRLRLLGAQFWLASVGLLALGSLLTQTHAVGQSLVPFVLVVPLTAVLGLAQALRPASSGLRDVEASSVVGVAEVAAGVALALMGFDGALAALATLVLAVAGSAPFVALLSVWLGPLVLLTGVSLPVALRWGTVPAVLIGGGPWCVLAAFSWVAPQGLWAQAFTLPVDTPATLVHLASGVLGMLVVVALLVRDPARVTAPA